MALSVWTERAPKAEHGRWESRTLWALADPWQAARLGDTGSAGRAWPGVGQLCRLERRRTCPKTGTTHLEVSYAITSLPPAKADAARLLALLREYWSIENRLHYVRDVTLGEDACQVRCGAAPQVVAACRNLALALLRRAGATNVAQALRTHAARPSAAVTPILGHCLE